MENFSERSELHLNILRKEVEETFGKRIDSSRDCNLLSEEIYSKTSNTINPNTLRRLFGLVKADHQFSAATVNILATYCGFKSLDELAKAKLRVNNTGGKDYQSDDILKYLVSLFSNTPTKGYHNETFLAFVKSTIQFLELNPGMFDPFQRAIAKTQNGQDFYFEQFVNIDALNSYYGEGLRYYLAEKKTAEAQIFGHSLLCLKAWLTDDVAEVKIHYEAVMQQKLNRTIHTFVCGRYFVTQLLYRDVMQVETESLLESARYVHSTLKPEIDRFKDFPCFEHVMAPALLMTGNFDEASYYINYAFKNYPHKSSSSIDEGFFETFDLYNGLTLAINRNKSQAERVYQQIRPSAFYFLTRKTNTIMYLIIARILNKNNEKWDQQLKDLIEETGFKKLLPILGKLNA